MDLQPAGAPRCKRGGGVRQLGHPSGHRPEVRPDHARPQEGEGRQEDGGRLLGDHGRHHRAVGSGRVDGGVQGRAHPLGGGAVGPIPGHVAKRGLRPLAEPAAAPACQQGPDPLHHDPRHGEDL
eukprot:15470945-Alexandrium_andersonii.AAC.1